MSTSPPDVIVDHSSLWVHATSADDVDVDGWSVSAAQSLWAATGGPVSDGDVERLAGRLALLAEATLAAECFGAFFLCPEAARGPLAVLRLNGATYPAGTTLGELAERFLLPDEQQVSLPDPRDTDRWIDELYALAGDVQVQPA